MVLLSATYLRRRMLVVGHFADSPRSPWGSCCHRGCCYLRRQWPGCCFYFILPLLFLAFALKLVICLLSVVGFIFFLVLLRLL
jgi:cobalamin synthase